MHVPKQIRDAATSVALDAVEAGKTHATDLVSVSAEHAAAAIDRGAHRRRRNRRFGVLLLVGALVLALTVVLRRARTTTGAGSTTTASTTASDAHYDVVPASDGGWDVVGPHGSTVAGHHDTQAHGIEHASELASRDGGGEVVIHGLDGAPRDTRTVAAGGSAR